MVDNKTISPRIVLRLVEKRQDKTVKSDASKKNVTERKCVQCVSLHKEGGIIYRRHFRLMANRYLLLVINSKIDKLSALWKMFGKSVNYCKINTF